MLLLLLAYMAAGRFLSGGGEESVKAMVLTTGVRNVGVALVVATACFPGTAVVSSATAYGIFQTVAMAVVALFWGRVTSVTELAREKAA
jgi:BASS family bile acid:Na+ symporter